MKHKNLKRNTSHYRKARIPDKYPGDSSALFIDRDGIFSGTTDLLSTSTLRRIILLCFCLIFFTLPIYADQLIIEPDMGRKPILDAINHTQHSLNLVMYGFTDPKLLDVVIQKHNEGKTLKVILEAHPYKSDQENNKTIAAFNEHDITWKGELPSIRLIHQKTMILDNKTAIVMTFNFTRSTFRNERNFALVIDNPAEVNAIRDIFDADWNDHPLLTRSRGQAAGRQLSNLPDDIILSPENSRNALLSLIEHAKVSILVYAQSVNDYKMIGALANAARRSVNVQIITSQHLREKQTNYLEKAGVKIQYNKKLIIHAKVWIVDNEKAVIGSINMTKASLEDNRELAVVTRDPEVITQLNQTFTQDWNTNASLVDFTHDISKTKSAYSRIQSLLKTAW
jgi:cardiolipin synthase